MKASYLGLIFASTFSTCIAKEESRVSCTVTVGDDVFGVLVKPAETGTMNWKTDQVVQKGDPPLGWSIEVTPAKLETNKFLASVVVHSTMMTQDTSDYPVNTYAKCTFRFSLPVDGKVHSKNLLGLNKVTFKLNLTDVTGEPIKMATSRAIRRR